jgi:hypothetical protein
MNVICKLESKYNGKDLCLYRSRGVSTMNRLLGWPQTIAHSRLSVSSRPLPAKPTKYFKLIEVELPYLTRGPSATDSVEDD